MENTSLYQKYSDEKHWENHPTIYAEKFAKFLKNNNFKGLIVDIGCGNGKDVEVFAKQDFESLGIDISKKYIESNKNKLPKLNFEVQNVEKLNFKDNSVEAFFMINVIHYANKEKAIHEVFRTLKSKGYFFIHFNIEIIDKNGKYDYNHDEKEILKLISKFKIIKKTILKRKDYKPIEHTHNIMELILQKP